jgi:YD repeat-containing protein
MKLLKSDGRVLKRSSWLSCWAMIQRYALKTFHLRTISCILVAIIGTFSVSNAFADFPARIDNSNLPYQLVQSPCDVVDYQRDSWANDVNTSRAKYCLPLAQGSSGYGWGWSISSGYYGWPGLSFLCGNMSCMTGSVNNSIGTMWLVCPTNSTLNPIGPTCTCNKGFEDNPQTHNSCSPLVETIESQKPQACPAVRADGNPIYALTGAKKEVLTTGVSLGGLDLVLTYDTTNKLPANRSDVATLIAEPNAFGALWKSSYHHRLSLAPGLQKALVTRGDGKVINFNGNGAGIFTSVVDNSHKLTSISGGYRFTDVLSGASETFDSSGNLLLLTTALGRSLDFSYSGGNLAAVKSDDGRMVTFGYTNDLVTRITDANGLSITLGYDASRNLQSLTWPDGKSQQFLYENSTFPWALTGKLDENNSRYSTFTYDAQGRAVTTEHAGGVEKFSIGYTSPPNLVVTDSFDAASNTLYRLRGWQLPTGTTVTLPNGQISAVGATSVNGMPSVVSSTQPAGSGCAASTSAVTYDANGNVASTDDFSGQRSCFANDLSRNLRTTAVEGLVNTVSCTSVLGANASLPAGIRKVGKQWHPDWSLVIKETQPLKIVTSVYNGQPDPFNSNAPASCAPAAAQTVDGKPIPVLCKQVEQATTDPDGSLGLAAPIDTAAVQRTSSFTYDATGRMLTGTDSLNRVTTSAYYNSSTALSGPSDSSFNSVSLLLHGDGTNGSTTFVDSSSPAKTVTPSYGTPIVSQIKSKFGGASLYFSGASSVAVDGAAGNTFWSSDWTAEFWAATDIPDQGVGAVFGNRDSGGSGTGGGQLYLSYSAGLLTGITFEAAESGNFVGYGVGTGTPGFTAARVSQGFDHIAVTKQGLIYTFFLNGVRLGSISRSIAITNSPSSLIWVGAANKNEFYPYYFKGYLDDFRITLGAPRYINNFTSPTQAFANAAPVIDPNAVGHIVGDLQSVTNAAGHVTQFTQYDAAGRVRQMVDPKGVVTDTVYTPRGWVSSVTVTPPGGSARTTSYSYDGVGQLTHATLPDGATLGYSYDAAHRLVGVTDAIGNTVTYSLDNAGNRVGEQIKDPLGALQRSITRVYDALNRVQQVTGAAQ